MRYLYALCLLCCAAIAQTGANPTDEVKPEWVYSKEDNPLSGKSFDRFILTGKYFKAPSSLASDPPKLIVGCIKGKFASGEFSLGAVAAFSGTQSFKGVRQAQVDMRIDERKNATQWLEVSNDLKTLFFDRVQLLQLMTGRLLGHPSDRATLTHRVVLGVLESLGNEVIVQFDMPDDPSEMVQTCGLEWGKQKK
jgi:hypothetical protein